MKPLTDLALQRNEKTLKTRHNFSKHQEENQIMQNVTDTTTCPFCNEFRDIESSEFREMFPKDVLPTRFIKSTDNFVALPGIGAIKPGYVLIVPKNHIYSFAYLDQAGFAEARRLKEDLIELISLHFSHVIVCEHGPIGSSSSAGSCVDHAHLHLFPTNFDLFPDLSRLFKYRILRSIDELVYFRQAQKPYIYYERDQMCCAFEIDQPIQSQLLRRLVWEKEGRPDEWDWGVFIGHEPIIDTVKILRKGFEQRSPTPYA